MNFARLGEGRSAIMGYWFLGLLIAVVLVIFVGSVMFQSFMPGFSGYRYGFFPFGFFFFPFGFILVILLISSVFRWAFWPRWWGGGYRRGYWGYSADAFEILRERYARGEISKEQFDQMMQDLQKSTQRQSQ
jgi:putative membrane protein